MSKEHKLIEWLLSDDTGASSKAIASHMALGNSDGSFPWDPSDIGRCFRLLEAIPEWKSRIEEMGVYSKIWVLLADKWQEIYDCMEDEVGIDWRKGKSAPKTYELMKRVMDGSSTAE